jgi:hypothetical protein
MTGKIISGQEFFSTMWTSNSWSIRSMHCLQMALLIIISIKIMTWSSMTDEQSMLKPRMFTERLPFCPNDRPHNLHACLGLPCDLLLFDLVYWLKAIQPPQNEVYNHNQ